jgi:CSLREA domain-containing protein
VSAATLSVTTSEDGADANAGDGTCATPAGMCTLRAAVQTANALAGPDSIVLPAGTYALRIGFGGENAAAGGDLDVAPGELTITGENAATTAVDGRGFDRVFQVLPGASLTINGVTVTNGRASDSFGGGGILNGGALTLNDAAVTGSRSGTGGGGIFNSAGSATLTNVALSGNTALSHGGGLWNFGGQVALVNVTVSGNTAGSTGGAIRNDGVGAMVSLVNVTVAGNSSNEIVAALMNAGGPAGISLKNSIVSGPPGDSCFGPIASGGFNIDTGGSCGLTGAGDKPGTDPLLGPLAANGGGTQTQALLTGSPALDSADPASCPATDQRRVTRPQGAGCDIGAYELAPPRSFKRTLSLKLSEHIVARGKIGLAADGPPSCRQSRVVVQLKAGKRWKKVGSAIADSSGAYQVNLRDVPGTYRAVVKQASAGRDSCLGVTSRTRRHKD